jgi:hypothetical protein
MTDMMFLSNQLEGVRHGVSIDRTDFKQNQCIAAVSSRNRRQVRANSCQDIIKNAVFWQFQTTPPCDRAGFCPLERRADSPGAALSTGSRSPTR